jgi:diguanylate cyclase (GGDEF)-like protein
MEPVMQVPATPADEPERLAALRALRILDTPIEDRFERITRMAKRSFGVGICAISLIDRDRQWFKSIQGLSLCETSRDVSFCGHAILSSQVFVIPDAKADPRFQDNPLVTGEPNIRFYAGCPVRSPDGSNIGTLCLIDQTPRSFNKDDEFALRDFARMVEDELNLKVVSKAQDVLIEELDRSRLAAAVDPLTRIWNRGAIMEILNRELAHRSTKPDHGTGVVMIDFDHFKKINDGHGHLAGDAVLREGVARMLGIVRAIDAIGRYGGEEFIAVLSFCQQGDVAEVAERLRASICAHPMAGSGKLLDVTASFGTAWCPHGQAAQPETMIAAADAAVYRAKSGGRNRVEIGRLA